MFFDSSFNDLRDELESRCILSHHVVTEGKAVTCVYQRGGCVCVCVTSMSLLQRAQEGYVTSIQHLSTALLVLVLIVAKQ